MGRPTEPKYKSAVGPPSRRRLLCLALLLGACRSETPCLSDPSGACAIASPCPELRFTCEGGTSAVEFIGPDTRPTGASVLAAVGDVRLSNDRVVAVIDALDARHHLSPGGGTIIDLGTGDGRDDALNGVPHGVGLLPWDVARYEQLRVVDEGPIKAVIVTGSLDGAPEHRIVTRYEIRPCEPGIRVRTEVVNRGRETRPWSLSDGLFWGDRSAVPFAPVPGRGFDHPSFGLGSVNDVYVDAPFVAASDHADPGVSYALVACDADALSGFHSETISVVGTRRTVVHPNEHLVYERFIAVAGGRAVSGAIDHALGIRAQLHGEAHLTLSGRVETTRASTAGPGLGDEGFASILVFEGDATTPRAARRPWTQALPGPDGRWSAEVPADRRYLVELHSFGRAVATQEIEVARAPVELPSLRLPETAELELVVRLDGRPTEALVHVVPADDETRSSVEGRQRDGAFRVCAPWLGPPHGGSPACDRILSRPEPQTLRLPPGRYVLLATAGPFASIARRGIELGGGARARVELELSRLPVLPSGVLSADFHVHGASSFDSSIPDETRVRSMLAAGLDVIAATDHDAVGDYTDTVRALGAEHRLAVLPGLEATALVLNRYVPDTLVPKVIGHWNFWPLPRDDAQPRRGAPDDEKMEPGLLFDRVRAAGLAEHGVIQLNHPWGGGQLGRDYGFPEALELDLRRPLVREDDGSAAALLARTPPGATASNLDYHAQEVMNGSDGERNLAYRAYWFWLLSQGVARAGTANSDAHGLSDNTVGTPRSLVWTDTTVTEFDVARFDAAVRAGRMVGTNGPVIDAVIVDGTSSIGPSLEALRPGPEAMLAITVRAAPWVPVDELRVVRDGVVIRRVVDGLPRPDPLGRDGILRYSGRFRLADLLPDGDADAWLVIEAGAALPLVGDLDCNGVPDTGDHDTNGVVDWRDVDRTEDGVVDALDLDWDEDGRADAEGPPECEPDETGPLLLPRPLRPEEAGFEFDRLGHGGPAAAFTNPFLIDRGAPGWTGPGLGAAR